MKPRTEKELSEIIKATTNALIVKGGGTRYEYPIKSKIIDTRGFEGILDYTPGALTMVALAGTLVSDIEKVLADEGQMLAFEPSDYRGLLRAAGHSTIGGVFSTNASGPRRVQVGAARDFLLGVKFIDGNGVVIKSGGRVMKNVTGYDLVKLMAGSWGTLGVITEVSFKVLPRPEAEATLVLNISDHDRAIAAMTEAICSPYEANGLLFLPQKNQVYIRIEGFEVTVQYRMKKLKELLFRFGELAFHKDRASKSIWLEFKNMHPISKTIGDLWKIVVKPSDAPKVYKSCGLTSGYYDWAGGLIWAEVPKGHDPRPFLKNFPGYATRIRGHDKMISKFQPQNIGLEKITNQIKSQFDPRGILNRGLMN